MADCDRNREACAPDNTGGGVSPPEEPPLPQASRASAPAAASPRLASAAPESGFSGVVSRETLAACGSRAATICSLLITWRLPQSTNARYGSELTRWSKRPAGPLQETCTECRASVVLPRHVDDASYFRSALI